MSKNTCVIYAPIESFSGYGSNARDKVKAIIDLKKDEWEIQVISCRWGATPLNFIAKNPEWGWLRAYIISGNLTYKPDYMIWITIPSEFQAVGKYNIGITAGIETNICPAPWIEGCNRMDLVLTSSEHSKNVLLNTKFQINDNVTKQPTGELTIKTPVEVIMEGCNIDIYKPLEVKDLKEKDLLTSINSIPENFLFLFMGHWMSGDLGEDRKNVGLLVKAFYEIFKNKANPPALVLKTSGAGSSYMDRREIQKRVDMIRRSVPSKKLPNVYILHGDFSDTEINELYNHSKIKAMISLTKGEGFGRPLLEFSLVNKPIIASYWSGHLDFLKPEYTAFVDGTLTPVHHSAQVKDILIDGSSWFTPNHNQIGHFITDVFNNYKPWKEKGKRQGYFNRNNFAIKNMDERLKELFNKYLPELPKRISLKIPNLNKIEIPKKELIK